MIFRSAVLPIKSLIMSAIVMITNTTVKTIGTNTTKMTAKKMTVIVTKIKKKTAVIEKRTILPVMKLNK